MIFNERMSDYVEIIILAHFLSPRGAPSYFAHPVFSSTIVSFSRRLFLCIKSHYPSALNFLYAPCFAGTIFVLLLTKFGRGELYGEITSLIELIPRIS